MEKKKYSDQLCPKCKTGRDSYLLDNRSPFCPYLYLHKGDRCKMFEEIPRSEDDAEFEM